MNQKTVENSIKVGNSTFDVVAVPQTNISQILDTTTNTKPVNVKIRIRNKAEMTDGLISVPKLTTTGPKKVRLVSSDQTIISFDIFMETENKKKVGNRKKPNYTFFELFKPSGCFNKQNDDDIYPYIPSSSNETYRAKSASNVNDLQDDKVYDEKFALRKSLPPASNNFLGKCKPGGCLDPPFGEDKYIYKPKNKMLAIDQNNIENHEFDEKCIENKKNTDEVTDKPDIVLHVSPSRSSIEETYSHSLITYPPALFSSDILEEYQNKNSKPRNTENKARISINEFSDTYFMPPKKQKIKNDETVSIEFSETPNIYGSYDKIVVDSFTQTGFLPLPKNELFNQATEPKLFSTQYISSSRQRITETNLSKDNNATVGLSELSSINIKLQISKSKSSISDVSDAELNLVDDTVENKIKLLENPQIDMIKFQGSENHNAETKTDTNLFETNLDNTVIIPSSLIYKDTIIIQDATKTANDSRISKNISKSNLDELKLKSNNLIDNFLQTSLDRNISCIENQSIGSSFLVNTDENEIKFADFIHSDEITLKHSNTTVIERSAEIDNLRLILLTESVELKHSNGKLNQTKETDPSKISVNEEMHQKDFRQNKQLQDLIRTAIVNNEKVSDTIDIISVKKYPVKTEDKKYGDQDFSTMELSEAADVQMTDHKSIRISSEATNYFSDSISTKPIESDKVSSALSNDLKAGSFIISDNIDINNEKTPVLQEKISLPLQLRQKDNSNNIYYEDKQFSSVTIQSLEPTSSLNLSTPLALPEKTSSCKRYPIKNDSVKYDNKNGFADDQILISPSSLDLSSRAAVSSDNLEVHGPTDIVHDLIPNSNVPVVIQSLQNIDIDSRHYLPSKDHYTEIEESDDGGTSKTKTELQIKNSKLTLLSHYKTSATPTDYLEVLISPSSLDLSGRAAAPSDNLEVQGPTDIVHDLIPTSNFPVEIQSLQNMENDGRRDLPTKDYFTEKEGSHVRGTSEMKTEFQIKNSKVTLLSDYKTSATPTDYLEVLISPSSLDLSGRAAAPSDNLEVQGPTDIVHDLIPTSNVPVEIQSLQNMENDGRHDLPTKDYLTEKEGSHVRGTSETKTELQIKNSKVTLLSDYKTSATPTDYLEVLISPSSLDLSGRAAAPSDNLKVQGPTDIVHDHIPISNVSIEIQSLQNMENDGRRDLPTKDYFTAKEGSHVRGTSETKTELQIKNSKVTLLSDYKTSATPTDYLEVLISPSSLDLSGRAAAPSDNLKVQGPTDIVHDHIPTSNVSIEIQSLQNIEIDGRHDLPTKDYLTEKEGSHVRGTSETKTEFQIKNSMVTLLSDNKTSTTPTDYLEVFILPSSRDLSGKAAAPSDNLKVQGPTDIVHDLIPTSNVPVEIQSLQNIEIDGRHNLPTKDYLTEKEGSHVRGTSETKTELQIKNSKVTLLSDYKTSATPTDYLEVHRSGDIAHGLIPIHNAPLEIQTLQNIDIKNLLNLPNEDHFTEKVSDEKEALEKETELHINNSSVAILSAYKTSAISTDLKVHGPGDNELGFMPISNVPVKFPNQQNIGIEDRHDLPTKDHFTEKEKPDQKVPLNTKTELQNNNNHVAIISDYKTSSHYAHDNSASIASINKKVENQSKISKADLYSKPIKLYIPKVLQAHTKETLMNVDEIILTKAEEKNLIRNENLSIEINLGFYSFVNNKNETLIRTFDTSKDLRIDTQDKNITIIKSILRKNDSEIRIPVNSEMDLTLQIKKTFNKVSGLISKWEFDNTKKESMNKDVLLQETLHSVYENLVPVQNIIQNLKKEADFLTQQQVSFREILSTMKKTSQGIINKNKSCTCNIYSI